MSRMRAQLEARDISWGAQDKLIVDRVSCTVAAGTMLGLIGPNGAGKTSLLRCLALLRRPDGGTVTLGGDDIARWHRRKLARVLGVVFQESAAETDPVVWDVVLLGRTPYKGIFDRNTREDDERVETALGQVGMTAFIDRRWQTLSGGERQRIHLARALAQDTDVLLLDEPTNHLDLRYQLETLALIKRLGITTVAALHDLNLAGLFCDQILVMQDGRAVQAGYPRDVLTAPLIRDVYGVESDVSIHERTGRPTVVLMPPGQD